MKSRFLPLIHFMLAATVLIGFACKKSDPEPPVQTWRCDILQPADSSAIQLGDSLLIEAMPLGFGSDVKVTFSIDTMQFIEATQSPYNVLWITEGWDTGWHLIRADAYENMNLASADISVRIIDTIIPPKPPVAVFSIAPESGNTDSLFVFDASETYDLEDPFDSLRFRWDVDGDGAWETEYSSNPVFQTMYTHPSNYSVVLEVIDRDGMTGSTTRYLLVKHSGNPGACGGQVSLPHGGKVYHTVGIGEQCWLKENLDIGRMLADGEIPSDNDVIEKFCYDNDSLNCEIFGGLYAWEEMMKYFPVEGGQGICPNGWHIPTDAEWKELEGYADSHFNPGDPEWDQTFFRGLDAGKHLKSIVEWFPGGEGDNVFSFGALPGGFLEEGAGFHNLGEEGRYWSSTHDIGHNAFSRIFSEAEDRSAREYSWDKAAFSVRCIKNR